MKNEEDPFDTSYISSKYLKNNFQNYNTIEQTAPSNEEDFNEMELRIGEYLSSKNMKNEDSKVDKENPIIATKIYQATALSEALGMPGIHYYCLFIQIYLLLKIILIL